MSIALIDKQINLRFNAGTAEVGPFRSYHGSVRHSIEEGMDRRITILKNSMENIKTTGATNSIDLPRHDS